MQKGLNKLVDGLVASGVITTPKVAAVMRAVDRAAYYHGHHVYEDCPQSIGYNATISAPHMHALALVSLAPHLVRSGSKTACSRAPAPSTSAPAPATSAPPSSK